MDQMISHAGTEPLEEGEFVASDRAQLAAALGAARPIGRVAEEPGDFDVDDRG